MAVKSMIWKFVGVFRTLILIHLVLLVGLLILQDGGLAVNAEVANAGALFLDQRELEVKWIAANASLNDANCGSLASCRAECSRAKCRPLSGESLQCVSLPGREFYKTCPREDFGYRNMMLVNYNKSYVTLPAGASTTSLETEVARDVCLQRRLDSTFKTVSVPSNYSKVYFGSISGAFRSFPGIEGRDSECTSYDPRRRPWYLKGISVSKDVKILVDVAKSMGQLLTVDYKRPPRTSYLDVAKNMTSVLLQTFSPGDNVEVFTFDATNATSLGGALAVMYPYNHFNPNPELAGLVTNVDALAASSVAGASDLNGAIRRAAGSFNQLQSLKVIIVLSNGLFLVNSTSFPSAALQIYRAKLMVYKLPTNDDGGDTFLQSTHFQKDICSVQGSLELLDALATSNPLYSMRSYFTYLASMQLSAAGGKVTWTDTYQDLPQKYSVVRPTYPAFGRDGLLIGVAGADVVLDELDKPLRDLVWQELSRRRRGAPSAPANISMKCYYQTSIGPANWSSCPPLDSSGICPQTDTASTLAQLTCCENHFASDFQGAFPSIELFMLLSLVLVGSLSAVFIIGCYCEKKSLIYYLRQRPVEEDPLGFYERIVISFGKHKSTRILFHEERIFLNERQCTDLSEKLLKTIRNIREIISCCGEPANLFFKPALGKLSLEVGKAKLLVEQCGRIDWYRAAVSQIHNEIAFQEILLDVGLCYNAIYEQARSLELERSLPEDLRESNVFMPASKVDVHKDQIELQEMLEKLALKKGESEKPFFARYLLERLNHPPHSNFHMCSTTLWMKESIPTRVLGLLEFLRAGIHGVCFTEWMGIPCAKKVFRSVDDKETFEKEARISAHLKHPCVVDFICCGDGVLRGDRFIAMEHMETDLSHVIAARCNHHFPLRVVVDIMVQIARGVCYLHGQGVAHRDLKPDNVGVKPLAPLNPEDHFEDHFEKHYCVKLLDFGVSKTKVGEFEPDVISFPNVGSTRYRAPEINSKAYLDGVGKASWFKADAFSFAVTCAHMLSLKLPFEDIKLTDLHANLMAENRLELPGDCPQELRSLLEDCWTTNPSHRPPFVEIWTRLEALRFKLLRGPYSTCESTPQGKSDEFIKVKIGDYIKRIIHVPLDELNGIATEHKGITVSPAPSIKETTTCHRSIEMGPML